MPSDSDLNPQAPESSALQDSGLLDLSRQLRNLVLLRPLFQFELNKGRLGDDSVAGLGLFQGLDTSYLCLNALDHMMEATAISSGATYDSVHAHLTEVARTMKPGLSVEQARQVADITIAVLENRSEGNKEFSVDFYDAQASRMRNVSFRLVRFEPDPFELKDTYRYSPSNEGYLVYLGMLDLTGELGQELMEKFLGMLIERGSFQSAQEAAEAARKLSLNYRQRIQERIRQAHRSPASVNWSRDLAPFLGNAREHVGRRQLEDLRMEESVKDALTQTDDPASRRSLSRLIETLGASALLRTNLVNDIAGAADQFLTAQRMLFRARRPSGLPDLEDQTLPQLMELNVGTLVDAADDIVSVFYPPQWPKLYDLNTVCALLLEHRVEDGALAVEDGELLPYKEPEPEFPKSMVLEVFNWAQPKIEEGRCRDIPQLLQAAEQEGRSSSWMRCMVMTVYQRFFVQSDGRVQVRKSGRFRHDLASGTNLEFGAPSDTASDTPSDTDADAGDTSSPENL